MAPIECRCNVMQEDLTYAIAELQSVLRATAAPILALFCAKEIQKRWSIILVKGLWYNCYKEAGTHSDSDSDFYLTSTIG